MRICSEEYYRDSLLDKCVPCSDICSQRVHLKCTAVCDAQRCIQQAGFYYDKLLQRCVLCQDVCGQHPLQCAHYCQDAWKPSDASGSKLRMPADHVLLIYSLLGLCLFTALSVSVLIMWHIIRRREQRLSCKPHAHGLSNQDSSKDDLVDAGNVGRGSLESQTPEPVETCRFCFPQQPTLEVESAVYQNSAHSYTATALPAGPYSSRGPGTLPAMEQEDRPFKMICSPSQEKTLTFSLPL
ncbi:hypothetical protein FKM82_002875 [Ascaphus truei]